MYDVTLEVLPLEHVRCFVRSALHEARLNPSLVQSRKLMNQSLYQVLLLFTRRGSAGLNQKPVKLKPKQFVAQRATPRAVATIVARQAADIAVENETSSTVRNDFSYKFQVAGTIAPCIMACLV